MGDGLSSSLTWQMKVDGWSTMGRVSLVDGWSSMGRVSLELRQGHGDETLFTRINSSSSRFGCVARIVINMGIGSLGVKSMVVCSNSKFELKSAIYANFSSN